jgi:oligopeptide/dipeptide ABC transporter ATP-binding protein
MVFQDTYSSLDPRQTVSQAIDEVQHVHFDRTPSERRKRTIELLDAVRVGDRYVDALPRALSGGQRQRVAIARSLAAQPSVLVLDEAVSALDVSTQAQILNLLSDLRSEFGLTYIFISHDLAVIRQVSDDVLVLYRGDLMEQAPAEELFGMPEHPYTGLLLDSIPRQGMELENRPDRGSLDEAGCLFSSRCSRAFDRCTEHPPIFDLTYGRRSRCWLVDPSAAHTSSPPVSLTTQQGGTDDQHRTAQ